ncbi:MAG: tetratricopeptide repeat-containing sulfotransferase family protein [Congregibacter sp.]
MASDDAPQESLKEIQGLLSDGRLDDARERLLARLASEASDVDSLYLIAVCERLAKRFDQAAEHLERLLQLAPEHGRALQEAGHLHRDQGLGETAIEYYARATQANPALLAAYDNQLKLLRESRRGQEAALVQAQLDRLARLPKALIGVTDLLAQDRILKAEQLCRSFLHQQPHNTEGMRLLAQIAQRFGALEEANFLLESACEIAPDDAHLRIELIRVLSKRQRFEQSLQQADTLLAKQPQNLQFQSLRAIELLQLGEYAAAIEAFDRILEKIPDDAGTLTSRGHALKTFGKTPDAIDSYKRASQAASMSGEAWYALANLKTYRFAGDEIAQMQDRLAAGGSLMDEVYLSFALGKAFEDKQDYAESFAFYERGNARKNQAVSYRPEHFLAEVDAQIDCFDSAAWFAGASGGCERPDPVFIVGMPRAGSTLLEQIIASHSQVDGTRELPDVLSLAQRLRRRKNPQGETPGYPDILKTLSDDELSKLGENYLAQTQMHRLGAAFFIDKMPNNFRHVALIKRILPNAKIIDARREPMACCFSNFKQLFAEGQEFSYDLGNLGHYYRHYKRLMQHWDSVLPGAVYRLQHEALLEDLEGTLKGLFDYLELPLEDACLRFHENQRPVRTPSSEQVRQPIFRDAQKLWQNYQPWLDPLREALDEHPPSR